MNLQQLQYFVAVAEEGSFTAAAERCHVSQSGLSAQIQRLERELGAPLFTRTTRSVTPTPAGRAALGPARDALAGVGNVQRAVEDVVGLLRGRLSVAMVAGCTMTPLFDALASFHQANPGVAVGVSESDSARMVEQVRAGVVDAALIGCAGSPPDDLESMVIVSEGLVAVVRSDHPAATASSLSVAELATHTVVCMPQGTGIRAVLDRAGGSDPSPFRIAFEASAPDAVVDLARRGLGVGVLSASMVTGDDDLVCVPIRGISEAGTLAIVWRRQPVNPALRIFLQLCRSAFGLDAR